MQLKAGQIVKNLQGDNALIWSIDESCLLTKGLRLEGVSSPFSLSPFSGSCEPYTQIVEGSQLAGYRSQYEHYLSQQPGLDVNYIKALWEELDKIPRVEPLEAGKFYRKLVEKQGDVEYTLLLLTTTDTHFELLNKGYASKGWQYQKWEPQLLHSWDLVELGEFESNQLKDEISREYVTQVQNNLNKVISALN